MTTLLSPAKLRASAGRLPTRASRGFAGPNVVSLRAGDNAANIALYFHGALTRTSRAETFGNAHPFPTARHALPPGLAKLPSRLHYR